MPPTLFLLLSSFGIVWFGYGGEGGVVTFEKEIGDVRLTFILILKSCGMGEWNPGTSSFLLHLVGGGGWRQAIIATSSRSRSLI